MAIVLDIENNGNHIKAFYPPELILAEVAAKHMHIVFDKIEPFNKLISDLRFSSKGEIGEVLAMFYILFIPDSLDNNCLQDEGFSIHNEHSFSQFFKLISTESLPEKFKNATTEYCFTPEPTEGCKFNEDLDAKNVIA